MEEPGTLIEPAAISGELSKMTGGNTIHKKLRAERAVFEYRYRLGDCHTQAEINQALSQMIQKTVGASGIALYPLYRGAVPNPDVAIHSEYLSSTQLGKLLISAMPVMNREMGPVSLFFEQQKRTRNVVDHYGEKFFKSTQTYNEFSRQCKAEHHIAAIMGTKQSPLGIILLTRSSSEPPFVERDLELTESIRFETEQILGLVEQTDKDLYLPTEILSALASSLPQTVVVLDRNGNIVWANRTAEQKLGDHVWSLSGNYFLGSKSPIIEDWQHAMQQPAISIASGVNLSNDLIVNRIERSSHEPLYLIVVPTTKSNRNCPLKELSAREREIAELAAQGYSPLNIGAMLSISVGTVRVHLKSIYRKLRVSSRVELALRLQL